MPDRVSKSVLARELAANTTFEIVSIDIADIDIGDDIGARLQSDQAEADTRMARGACRGTLPGSDRVPAGNEGEADEESRIVALKGEHE